MNIQKIISVILFNVTLLLPLFSQDNSIKEQFDDAEYFFQLEDYNEALVYYQKVYKVGFETNSNINYRIGICYLNLNKNREKAVEYLEIATKNVSEKYNEGSIKEVSAPIDAWLYLGNAYRIAGKLNEAIDAYEMYNNLTKATPNETNQFALNQIDACKRFNNAKQNAIKIEITNLGKIINNKEANYNPIMSANAKTLVFMSHTKFYEAVMISNFVNGEWTIPVNLNPDIKSDGDQFASYISPNGKTLLLSKQDNFNSDIYISKFENNNWKQSESLGKEINTKFWEAHACLSPDGNTLYFVSNREGGLGNTDIWMAQKGAKGEWTNIKNLGSTINTPFNEETPFLSPDGKQLYFSSQGHNSIGGFDVFYANLLANNTFDKPVNLHYPVNTADDDLYFCPGSEKYIAYLAKADKKGFGDLDIVKYETFNAETHPYNFKLEGAFTKGLEAINYDSFTVTLVQNPDKNLASQVASDSGTYTFTAVAGKYALRFYTSDFVYVSPFFEIPQDYENNTYPVNTINLGFDEAYNKFNVDKQKRLAEQTAQKQIVIRDILFDFNSFSMMPAANNEITNIANILKQFTKVKLVVTGHTDSKGGVKINQKISLQRAKMVKDKLCLHGIDNKRVVIKGKGKSSPIAINENTNKTDNPQGRAYNRRVEFELLNNTTNVVKVEHITVPNELKMVGKKLK